MRKTIQAVLAAAALGAVILVPAGNAIAATAPAATAHIRCDADDMYVYGSGTGLTPGSQVVITNDATDWLNHYLNVSTVTVTAAGTASSVEVFSFHLGIGWNTTTIAKTDGTVLAVSEQVGSMCSPWSG